MYCDYCGQDNHDDAYRCARCRTRLEPPSPRGGRGPVLTAATAPKLAPEQTPAPAPRLRTHDGGGATLTPGTRPMRQPGLFPEAPAPVSRLEAYTPIRSRTRALAGFAELKPKKQGKRVSELQASFDYDGPGPNMALKRATDFEGARAPWPLLVAGTLTDAMIVGVFSAIAVLVARQALISMTGAALPSISLPAAGAGLFVVAIVYKALWAMFGQVTPGLQGVGVELVGFDGRSPSFTQRMIRVLVGWLGMATVGLGILYSFVDRKGLCWHDDASQSYHSYHRKDRE
ncbi:MAG TPA: RDD family protein [Bryobacteraceae bacterium]|nr:RDD family protein [Bryobacteraceae bacterium]HPT26282.1 RDD family protein [Bryobacteraceae bacterium]